MPGVSIHVVDVVRGQPAVGLEVSLRLLTASGPREIGAGTIGCDGQLAHPMTGGAGIEAGDHEVLLRAGAFYRREGLIVETPAFQETIAFRFTISNANEHFHLPFKMSPWGISVWRGR